MALGFSRLVCMYVLFLSIPSARYTDKADGPRREAFASAARPGASQRDGGRRRQAPAAADSGSARIQFDDHRFFDLGAEFIAIRRLLERAFELGGVHRDPR